MKVATNRINNLNQKENEKFKLLWDEAHHLHNQNTRSNQWIEEDEDSIKVGSTHQATIPTKTRETVDLSLLF